MLGTHLSDMAGIIQLAVAPVFLLAGIAGFLNVMAARLGRIIDRVRVLDERMLANQDHANSERWQAEYRILFRRATITNYAIGLSTGSALSVCILVASLFIGDYLDLAISGLIVVWFSLAMLLLIMALGLFLKEFQLATRTLYLAKDGHA